MISGEDEKSTFAYDARKTTLVTQKGKSVVDVKYLGEMMNCLGLFFPHASPVVLTGIGNKPKTILPYSLKEYEEMVLRLSASGKVTPFAFLRIVEHHLRKMKKSEIDEFMLTYESYDAKGRLFHGIKGLPSPEAFDKKNKSLYQKAAELRHNLLHTCKESERLTDTEVDEYLKCVGIEDSKGTVDFAKNMKDFSKYGVMCRWSNRSLPLITSEHRALEMDIVKAARKRSSFAEQYT